MDLRLAGFSAEALEGGEFPNSSYGSPLFFLEHLCFFFFGGGLLVLGSLSQKMGV